MSEDLNQKYETVIGLEVHLQLDTKTKIFCGCENVFGAEPNSRTCPRCLGLPGTLPVLNKKVLEYGIKIGLALDCEINEKIKFDRKNYYYPDLPKAYQISQFDMPVAKNGHLIIPMEDGSTKRIGITRGHMEEDAGKLIHDDEANCTLADYNRTGTPLLEIVSEPDLRSAQEAYDYLQTLKLTLQYLNVSDCDMEKGSLRCDANISIRPRGQKELGTKTELKNMNSFKAVRTALEFEIKRHQRVIESGEKIIQETLLWDDDKQTTISMRTKEDAHDYRYFPEPDLVPFMVPKEEIEKIRATLPETPNKKFDRFVEHYKISEYDARILIQDPIIAQFFENCAKDYKDTKNICNWINGQVLKEMNTRKKTFQNLNLSAENLISIMQKIDNETISNLAAKDILSFVIETGKTTEEIIEEKGLAQVSDDSALEAVVDELIKENSNIADQIRGGNEKAIGFFVGQAMKKTQGKANPKKIGDIITRRLLND